MGSQQPRRTAAASRYEAEMIARYAPLVKRIAASLDRVRPLFLDRDDACQDGMIALLRAVRTHPGDAGDKRYESYLKTSVRGAMIDGIRDTSGISRRDYREARRIRQAIERGEAVTPEEKDKARLTMASAWMPPEALDGAAAALLTSPEPGPEQRLQANQELRRAIDVLQAQPVRDRTIFIACELNGDKQADIAAHYKISVARVSQIVKKVRHEVILAVG